MLEHMELEKICAGDDDIGLFQELCAQRKSPHLVSVFHTLLSLFLSRQVTVLDVNAGLGDLGVHLCRNGFETVGIVNSRKLFALAQAKTQQENVGLQLKMGDIRDLHLDMQFGAVVAKNHIQNILDKDDLMQALQGMYDHLTEYGVLCFDFPTRQYFHQKHETCDIDGGVRVSIENSVINIERLVLSRWQIASKDYSMQTCHFSRIYNVEDILFLLCGAGFQSIRFFDADLLGQDSPISEVTDSTRQIMCVARRLPLDEHFPCASGNEI